MARKMSTSKHILFYQSKNFQGNIKSENSGDTPLKPFQMECLETWFKPTSVVSEVAAYVESKSSNNDLEMKLYWQLLKQSIKNSKNFREELCKQPLIKDSYVNSIDENKETEDLTDLSYEELLSVMRNTYNSAIEQSGNIVTASKRIVNMIVNYCKKHYSSSLEENIYNIFKDHLFMTAKRISEKYEMFDSEEVTEKKIKECQIQVLLILGIENLRMCPDKSNCVTIVTSLLRIIIFYNGPEDSQNFLYDVLKKSFSNNLYDILVEIGDELNMPIFDDAESTNSPTDTLSSEINNDDEVFSSVASSVLSEKSTSSMSSHKGNKYHNDNKESKMERKLLRYRSDISDNTRYRQVLLPRSSKKKKRKTAANKAIRYSPRVAAKRNDGVAELVSEKPSKVCRNLFSGDKSNHTPKKNNNEPSTLKNKKKNCILKTKYAAETPSYKQNHSAFQRRKSVVDQLSKSPKVIAESPIIMKNAKDGASKELLQKLQKLSDGSLKPTKGRNEQKSVYSSFKEYTPESKRRLSLKLFSKLLTSPTARMGIKKCTKRLFDHISPQKDVASNKKHKPSDESGLLSNSVEID